MIKRKKNNKKDLILFVIVGGCSFAIGVFILQDILLVLGASTIAATFSTKS